MRWAREEFGAIGVTVLFIGWLISPLYWYKAWTKEEEDDKHIT